MRNIVFRQKLRVKSQFIFEGAFHDLFKYRHKNQNILVATPKLAIKLIIKINIFNFQLVILKNFAVCLCFYQYSQKIMLYFANKKQSSIGVPLGVSVLNFSIT